VGIDVGKFRHVAGFLSRTLLERHQRFEEPKQGLPMTGIVGNLATEGLHIPAVTLTDRCK
jgi:hypothetical protein